MSLQLDLAGAVALVTGGSQGIGAATVRQFHAAGARVVINHPGLAATASDAAALAAELEAVRPGSALVAEADISNSQAVQAMMALVRDKWEGLDYLINNAAIIRDRTLARMSEEEWHSVIEVNLTGVFHCCKYGLEIMREGGAVVSLSSIAALHGFFGQANYAAAKSGVAAMMRVLAREGGKRRIRANAVAPGVVDTTMARTIPEEVRAEMVKNVPLGRFGEPDEIARVIVFLCSPWASYLNGQTIEVNGGWRG